MFKKLLMVLVPLALVGCTPATVSSSVPVVSSVCTAIHSDKFDLALKAYGAATDAVNLLIDAKVIVPGSPRAVAVANANDKVLAAFSVAENARQACDSASYESAIGLAQSAIADVRAALKR